MKQSVLISAAEIAERVAALGKEISEYYQGKKLNVVILLNGAFIFAADLVRCLDPDLKVTVDSLGVSSYDGTQSTGKINVRAPLKNVPQDAHILLIDDILDTGLTLSETVKFCKDSGAASVRTCVVLDKILPEGRQKHYQADWVGFHIPDKFVVGYGLDYNEQMRHLPYIGCMTND